MRVAICDDEANILTEYQAVLAAITEKHAIPASIELFRSGKELMFALEDTDDPIDLLFLDINMPEINGVDVARWVRRQELPCEIIFLTVSSSHMLSAFDVGAFHYILKGATERDRFEEICLKAFDKVGRKKQEIITVSCAGENRRIPLRDILFFEVQNYIIIVHYADTSFEFYSTLSKIENTLLGRGFARTHRSYLINLRRVHTLMRQELELDNGARVPVGRKYAEELKKLLQEAEGSDEESKLKVSIAKS